MQPTRKLAAILSSDVFGYSRLMADDEQATLDAIVDTRRVMAGYIDCHGGRVVDATGDALLAEFSSAVEAVRCALAIQRELARKNDTRPAERRMLLRIGLNLGDVIESDGALYGDGVNIAARLQTAGEPGGVCISESIRDQVVGKLNLQFDPVSDHQFKNIARPVRAYCLRETAVDAAERPEDTPAGEHRPATARDNLPRQISSFVGRTSEIATVTRMLSTRRLVTLLGSGGIGKTRLSIHVAADVAQGFADGVWLVELAALADPRMVTQAVATVLGVKEEPGQPLTESLRGALQGRQLLLVLDNCEHLLPACSELTRHLLQSVPQLKVLATSREPLRVAGEASYPVPALTTPDPQGKLSLDLVNEFESVHLFVDRALAARPSFELNAHNAAAVASICRRLDGIPLAIELAAARVRALSVENIAARLSDRFHLLTRGESTMLPRQQTLRALIDWSHDLLTEGERVLLRRLGVFAGGWTLEAAEVVGAADNLTTDDVTDLLSRLVERSMVELELGGQRYRLLETVRQYAQARLDESGEGDATRGRHLAYYLSLAEAASARLAGPDQAMWLDRLDPELENFLTAHAWCDRAPDGAEAGLRLMFALKLYLFNRGLLATLRWGVLDALARSHVDARTLIRCRALHTAGQVESLMGNFALAQPHLEQALSIARELGDTGRAAMVLNDLGSTCIGQGDRRTARRYLEEALALAKQRGDRRERAAALNDLAQLHRIESALEASEPLYEEVLALARELGDRESIAVTLLNLSMVAIGRGLHERARVLLLEAQQIAELIGSKLAGGNVLAVAGGLAALRADWVRAALLVGTARTQMARTGIRLDPADEAFLEPWISLTHQALGAQALASYEAAAAGRSYEQAMNDVRKWLQQGGA